MPSVSTSVSIGSAVGRQPALNAIDDQNKIITLLHRVLPEDGGPQGIIPPAVKKGTASSELIAAIVKFQNKNVPVHFRDGRVDPRGFTLGKLNALARSIFPIGPNELVFPPDLVFPPKPPAPPKPPLPPTPGVVAGLGLVLTRWKIEGNASISFSVGPTGAALARFFMKEDGDPDEHLFDFAGVTIGKGPLPAGINIAPQALPSTGSRIAARRGDLDRKDFQGECVIVGLSANLGVPAGGSVAMILFGARRPASVAGLGASLSSALAIGFTVGTFVGLDVGGSVAAGAIA